jgi:hypothetical protein
MMDWLKILRKIGLFGLSIGKKLNLMVDLLKYFEVKFVLESHFQNLLKHQKQYQDKIYSQNLREVKNFILNKLSYRIKIFS